MVLMVSAGLRVGPVVENMDHAPPPWRGLHTPFWDLLAFHTDHAAWAGCSLWDLIQPSFMFLVGTALAFSLAGRRAEGQSFRRMLLHAVWRAVVLVLLSLLLASNWSDRTNWTFTNVLAQIGLGYPLLFLVARLRPRWQFAVAVAVLAGYWGAFALYPRPPANLDLASVHLPADWHRLQGFASHWEKNTNLAARADLWLLNRFPRPAGKPYVVRRGRVPDAQLRAVPGDDDLRPPGRRVAARPAPSPVKVARDAGGRGRGPGRRLGARPLRRLSGRQAHLDAVVGRLQRGLVASAARRALPGARRAAVAAVGVPAGGRRRQLHRDLLRFATAQALGAAGR